MSKSNADILREKQRQVDQMIKDFVTVMAVDAKNHFIKNFEKQGFDDRTVQPWAERKVKDEGRAILVDSGDLRKSIQVVRQTKESVTIGSDLPYARIHNEGGTAWAFGRHKFLMPKRQFIGFSAKLKTNLLNKIKRRIAQIFK